VECIFPKTAFIKSQSSTAAKSAQRVIPKRIAQDNTETLGAIKVNNLIKE
jgi:hypothetical protein